MKSQTWQQDCGPGSSRGHGGADASPLTAPLSHIFFFRVCSHPTLWRPEYASYMIEGTPGQPYGGTMSEFNTVEGNMKKRRREASSVLNQNQTLCTITSFPRYLPPLCFTFLVTGCRQPSFMVFIISIFSCNCVGWLCRLGCPGFTKPEYRPSPVESSVAKSLFFPDEAINRHPRFRYGSCQHSDVFF